MKEEAMKDKKMGMCSVITCSQKAVKEIRFPNGAVGEYCNRHYAERINEPRKR